MGIENRDYVRENNQSGSGGFLSDYPAVRTLILITVIVYLAQIFVTRPVSELANPLYPQIAKQSISVLQQALQLDTDKVIQQGQVWRLLTCAFCHDRYGVWHILINMLFLYWFGRELETIYGSTGFAWFYITAAIFSSVAFILLQLVTDERNPAIGASGAVMAVTMVYAIFHPRQEIYVFFVVPVQIRFLLLIYVAYDLHPVLLKLAGTPVPTGIAHAAHLGGLLYGLVFYRTGFSLQSLWQKTSPSARKSARSTLSNEKEPRIIPMRGPFWRSQERNAPSGLDQEVDRILAKISESGRESLTDRELATLERASQKYGERSDD